MLPELQQTNDQITVINQFGGIDKGFSITEGKWSDMVNMTNDYFPVLGNRRKRGKIKYQTADADTRLTNPQGILGGKALAYVDDNNLYYDGTLICSLESTDAERQLVMMGAYLVVFPDGIIYNTYTKDTPEKIENETSASNVTITLCKLDGTAYDSSNTVVSSSEPSDKTKYWLDTSKDTAVLKVYSSSTAMWSSVGTTYVKFAATGIGVGFNEYDAAVFSGVDTGDWRYNGYDFNQSNLIYACDDDSLIVVGLINLTHTNSKKITFKRELPAMDYVCELDNRIWGCSSDNHEVYACKQGDPKNWNCFAGLDSDSYAATVGSQNVFTGIASYGGYVFFFKEDGYHKLYGSKPSNYELQWVPGRGVQFGSSKSIAICNGYLIFKSNDNFVSYDGSADLIGNDLGIDPYYEAVAGVFRNKYYVSMRDSDYTYRLYVYDTTKGTWCVEDNIRAMYMAYANTGLYIIDSDRNLLVVNPDSIYEYIFPQDTQLDESYSYPGTWLPGVVAGGAEEDTIEWSCTTGDIDLSSPLHKYIKRVDLRIWLDTDAKVKVEVMYDSSDEWINLMEYYSTRKRSYEIPFTVDRCDHMQMRFSGFGNVKIYSIAKVSEEGSDS